MRQDRVLAEIDAGVAHIVPELVRHEPRGPGGIARGIQPREGGQSVVAHRLGIQERLGRLEIGLGHGVPGLGGAEGEGRRRRDVEGQELIESAAAGQLRKTENQSRQPLRCAPFGRDGRDAGDRIGEGQLFGILETKDALFDGPAKGQEQSAGVARARPRFLAGLHELELDQGADFQVGQGRGEAFAVASQIVVAVLRAGLHHVLLSEGGFRPGRTYDPGLEHGPRIAPGLPIDIEHGPLVHALRGEHPHEFMRRDRIGARVAVGDRLLFEENLICRLLRRLHGGEASQELLRSLGKCRRQGLRSRKPIRILHHGDGRRRGGIAENRRKGEEDQERRQTERGQRVGAHRSAV